MSFGSQSFQLGWSLNYKIIQHLHLVSLLWFIKSFEIIILFIYLQHIWTFLRASNYQELLKLHPYHVPWKMGASWSFEELCRDQQCRELATRKVSSKLHPRGFVSAFHRVDISFLIDQTWGWYRMFRIGSCTGCLFAIDECQQDDLCKFRQFCNSFCEIPIM